MWHSRPRLCLAGIRVLLRRCTAEGGCATQVCLKGKGCPGGAQECSHGWSGAEPVETGDVNGLPRQGQRNRGQTVVPHPPSPSPLAGRNRRKKKIRRPRVALPAARPPEAQPVERECFSSFSFRPGRGEGLDMGENLADIPLPLSGQILCSPRLDGFRWRFTRGYIPRPLRGRLLLVVPGRCASNKVARPTFPAVTLLPISPASPASLLIFCFYPYPSCIATGPRNTRYRYRLYVSITGINGPIP